MRKGTKIFLMVLIFILFPGLIFAQGETDGKVVGENPVSSSPAVVKETGIRESETDAAVSGEKSTEAAIDNGKENIRAENPEREDVKSEDLSIVDREVPDPESSEALPASKEVDSSLEDEDKTSASEEDIKTSENPESKEPKKEAMPKEEILSTEDLLDSPEETESEEDPDEEKPPASESEKGISDEETTEEKENNDNREDGSDPVQGTETSIHNLDNPKDETEEDLFLWLKEQIGNIDKKGIVELKNGRYDFTETITVSKKDVTLINKNKDAAIFTRGKREDGTPFTGWLITVSGNGKLTIGHQNKPYEFDVETVSFEKAKKPVNSYADNKGKLPSHLIQEGETIYDAFQVEKTTINNREEVEFSDNNIIIDGRLFGKDDIKVDNGLVKVYGEFTLNGGEIRHNNVKSNYSSSGSYLGTVDVYGKMTINAGSIHDNKMGYGRVTPYRPSGIYVVNQGTLIMNGGSIRHNKGGSGVAIGNYGAGLNSYVSGEPRLSKFIMNGGEIHHNKANRWQQEDGGGVLILENAEFIMNGGEIHHNEAARGGGVAANSEYISGTDGLTYSNAYSRPQKKYHDYYPARFVMLGGKIHHNHAIGGYALAGSGGGIYVNTDRVHLHNGEISDNIADNMGGGIYISQVPIHLVLKDAIITGNQAVSGDYYTFRPGKGGGFWECPSGVTHVYFDRTVYLDDNEAGSSGDDFYSIDKLQDYTMNRRQVGSTFYIKLNRYDEFLNRIKYITDYSSLEGVAGQEFNDMNPIDYLVSLKFVYDDDTLNKIYKDRKKRTPADQYFLIRNNIAGKGGGIGSNANVIFGEPGDSFEVEIEKQWFDENREQLYNSHGKIKDLDVSADLYYGDIEEGKKEFITRVHLNLDNGFKVLLTELPAELSKKYKNPTIQVVEKPIDGWKLMENKVERMPAGIRIFKPWGWSKSVGFDADTLDGYYFTGDNLFRHYRDHQNNWDKGLDTEIEFKLHIIDKGGNRRVKTVQQIADKKTKIGYDSNWVINFDFNEFSDREFKITNKNLSVEFYYPDEKLFSSKEEYLKHTLRFPLLVEGEELKLEDVSKGRFINYDNIFHFYLKEQENGEYILQLPKIGIYSYGLDKDKGFMPIEGQLIQDFKGKAGNERFTVTLKNYENYQFKVKKDFTGFKPGEKPEFLKVYVTSKGERIKDKYGNDRYIILNEENGWTGVFDNLEPVEDPRKVYGIEEENKNYITDITSIYKDRRFSAYYPIDFWEENPEIPDIPVTILYRPYRNAPDSKLKVLYQGKFEYVEGSLQVNVDLPVDKLNEDIVTYFFDRSNVKDDDGNPGLNLIGGLNTILIESDYFYWDTGTVWDSYNVYFSDFKDGKGDDLNLYKFGFDSNGKPYEKLIIDNTMPRTDIDVEKTWETRSEDEVKVYLGRKTKDGFKRLKDKNGNDISLILNKENKYSGSFKDLPLVDTKGQLIEYLIEEEFLHGYYPVYEKVTIDDYIYRNPKHTDLYIKDLDEKLIYTDDGVLQTEDLKPLDQFNVRRHIESLNKKSDLSDEFKLTFGGLKFTFDRSDHIYIERFGDGSPKAYIINYDIDKEDGKVYYTLPIGLTITGLEDHSVHNLPAGDLVITKEVISKNPEDFERLFHFLIELEHEDIDRGRAFKIMKGLFEDFDEEAEINVEDLKDWFLGELLQLKNGEYVQIFNIPTGTEYRVFETDGDGFIVRAVNNEGVIGDGINLVTFINEKPEEPDNPPETPKTPPEEETPPPPETPIEPPTPVVPETPVPPTPPEAPIVPEVPIVPESPVKPEPPEQIVTVKTKKGIPRTGITPLPYLLGAAGLIILKKKKED